MPGNKKRKALSDRCSKRTRAADKEGAVSKRGEDCINILNDDCWRIILDYVELSDIVRSECVSKQWQQIVQRYLQGVRLCLRAKAHRTDIFVAIPTTLQWHVPIVKCRALDTYLKHHVRVIEKYGRTIVAADSVDGAVLTALGRHCPDLVDLRIIDPQYLRLKRREQFNKLRRVSFHNVIMFHDGNISKFVSGTLEELTIIHNLQTTGLCLQNATNLKRLKLAYCYALKDITNLLTAPLSELTVLDLQGNEKQILQNVFKLIEKTPKLVYLGLENYPVIGVGGLAEAICGLSRLKHLNLRANMSVDDSFMETVGNCGELRTVNIRDCKNVTSAGVIALCRGVGKSLTALDVSGNDHVTEDGMALCITLCPKLEFLNLRDSERVSSRFAEAAARARTLAGGEGGARGGGGGGGEARGGGGGGARSGGGGGRLRLALTPAWVEQRLFWQPEHMERAEKKKKKRYNNLILEEDLKWEDYLKE